MNKGRRTCAHGFVCLVPVLAVFLPHGSTCDLFLGFAAVLRDDAVAVVLQRLDPVAATTRWVLELHVGLLALALDEVLHVQWQKVVRVRELAVKVAGLGRFVNVDGPACSLQTGHAQCARFQQQQ